MRPTVRPGCSRLLRLNLGSRLRCRLVGHGLLLRGRLLLLSLGSLLLLRGILLGVPVYAADHHGGRPGDDRGTGHRPHQSRGAPSASGIRLRTATS